MRRRRLLELVLLLGACSSRTTPAPTQPEDAKRAAVTSDAADKGTAMSTSEDVVRAWAKGGGVTRYEGPALSGLDLFFVHYSSPEGNSGRGVIVDNGKVVTGQDAMRTVLSRGSQDAMVLAAYASYLLGQGAPPLVDDANVEAPPAWKDLIKPPRLDGRTLEYWTYQGQLGGGPQSGPRLLRMQVNLDTLAVTGASADKVAAGPQDAVESARAKLDRSAYDQKQGAIELGKLCSDPRVPLILASALASHKVPDTRKEIAKAMAGCKDAASVKALIAALRDSHAPVRLWAATSLAVIGDASAKAPLQQALAGERDYEAQIAMQRAIAKLGG